jgi:D-cysteine desulfhydrase
MYKNPTTQSIRKPLFNNRGISADVLRLDLIHPIISGNKWFKLKYHISEALKQGQKGIATFGGAYSNHLTATAVACGENSLKSIGIVRGEEPSAENHSIRIMRSAGMELKFVSRDQYRDKQSLTNQLVPHDYYIVPEGGQSKEGVTGAQEILDFSGAENYTHIICSVGTGTTVAGLVNGSRAHQSVIGISALKLNSTANDVAQLLKSVATKDNYTIIYDYHFGGYAKKTTELLSFMNQLYEEEKIPTDFVYTGKAFFALNDLTEKNYFPKGSNLLLIHTGGLQGNLSLPPGTLVF